MESEKEEEYLKKAKTSMAQQVSRKQKGKRGRPKKGKKINFFLVINCYFFLFLK